MPRRTRRTGPLALAGLAVIATALLSGCGPAPLAGTPSAAPIGGPTSAPTPIPVSAAPTVADPAVPVAAPGSGSTGGAPASRPPAVPAAPSATVPAPTARIESFRVVTAPVCPVTGTPDAPFTTPGNGVTIAWTVTGADGAAISVDDPGRYGAYGSSYPASGRLELSFSCTPSGTTTHTYTVWPAGAEGVSQTLTVSARAAG